MLPSRHDSYLQIEMCIQKKTSRYTLPLLIFDISRLPLVHLRAGDLVDRTGLIVVNVVQDTSVSAAVQLCAQSALWVVGAPASDLQVNALGVHLGLALLAGRVQSDLLVAEDVVAGGNGVGDGDLPQRACVLMSVYLFLRVGFQSGYYHHR